MVSVKGEITPERTLHSQTRYPDIHLGWASYPLFSQILEFRAGNSRCGGGRL